MPRIPTPPRQAISSSDDEDEPYVINPRGEREPVNFGKIGDRIRLLMSSAYGGKLRINRISLEKEVISRFKNGMATSEIDDIIVQVCSAQSGTHPDYSSLAARILISNLQRKIDTSFKEVYKRAAAHPACRLSAGFLTLVETHGDQIEERIRHERDFRNSGFSVATLMRSYLLRDPETKEIIELPQHMYMRVALAMHCMRPSKPEVLDWDEGRVIDEAEPVGGVPVDSGKLMLHRLEQAFCVYDMLSLKQISHASPTIFNAGTRITQYSSCFQTQADDSLHSLYQVLMDTAMMSKTAGGVSIEIGRVRAKGSLIRGSGGESSGISPYLQLCDKSQRYANQGGNRPGAFAIYLPVHHAEVLTFLEMGLFQGARYEQRADARYLKYALMVPDRFMVAIKAELDGREEGADWYLFSPSDAPDLNEIYDERGPSNPAGPGGSFSTMYDHYVSLARLGKIPHVVVRPSEIMRAVAKAISMTGNPYILFKDNMNRQSNLTIPASVETLEGVSRITSVGRAIVSSNLCAEVTIPCRTREDAPNDTLYSVCNLAAINLAAYVTQDVTAADGVRMDWVGIINAAGVLCSNLDNIIDLNHVPADGCGKSNSFFRAIGIGIMGLADVFMLFGYEFGAPEALRMDAAIHACIYYGATLQSGMLASTRGSFPAFDDSAAARGLLQPDLCVAEGLLSPKWEQSVAEITGGALTPERWSSLRQSVRSGLRNGYVTANMPTATSSNAVGVNECFEPYTTLKYPRKTMAGEFTLMCPHLVTYLQKNGMWRDDIADLLDAAGGSVAAWDGADGRPDMPAARRRVFRTSRELDQLEIVAHAAARNPFISQSQSMNLYVRNVELPKLLEVWISGWASGLKTGSYYVHSQPAASAHAVSAAPPARSAPAPERGDDCGGACSI